MINNSNVVRYLYSCSLNYGRMGKLDGLFVATEQQVVSLVGKTINFGEVLGKHSNIKWTFEEGEIVKLDVSQTTVEELVSVLKKDTISGINPIYYLDGVELGRCGYCDYVTDIDYWEITNNSYNDEVYICPNCGEEQFIEAFYAWES